MKKAESEKLKKQIISMLIEAGFSRTHKEWHDYQKTGSMGAVGVSVRNEKRWRRRGYDVDVFGRFDNPDKAIAAGFTCNPYSGKHNFLNVQPSQAEYIVSQYCFQQDNISVPVEEAAFRKSRSGRAGLH